MCIYKCIFVSVRRIRVLFGYLIFSGGNICRTDEFLCNNSLCKLHFWVCDGEDDCGDNSDEFSEMCGMFLSPFHFILWLLLVLLAFGRSFQYFDQPSMSVGTKYTSVQ